MAPAERLEELEEGLGKLEEELAALRGRESDERQRLGALAGSLADLELRAAKRGELEVVRFGRAVRIPYDALARLIDERRSTEPS